MMPIRPFISRTISPYSGTAISAFDRDSVTGVVWTGRGHLTMVENRGGLEDCQGRYNANPGPAPGPPQCNGIAGKTATIHHLR
jgi:hypothetical protein